MQKKRCKDEISGGWGDGELDEGQKELDESQKAQTSSCKINKYQGQHDDYS